MKFSAVLLVLAPLASAAASKEAAAGLPDLASASEKGHDLSSHGEGLQLAAKVCPANFPRKCSLGNFCCRTLKCSSQQDINMNDTTTDGCD
ncbi:hypothetical protein FMUND_5254 [Fusarium mundagurra]|uniref:Uncharacterized protein n=1 Tax=Fusarium mundagurra TaxID=1567541 RepID=A0A8H6DJ06_9HYPO|nr:hypothetical protein FMUND_5254 [Fusarium mundagurra]